jgi:hypothetical protein
MKIILKLEDAGKLEYPSEILHAEAVTVEI